MTFELVVQVISALTLVAGFAFGAMQVLDFRRHREREVALELVHSFQTPEFAEAVFLVMGLPDGLSRGELEARVGDRIRLVSLFWTTFESLGILVFRGEVTIDLAEDFFSGPVIVGWRKMAPYAAEVRAESGRDTMGEWFQWLAERMMEREGRVPPVPAHIQHRDWRARRAGSRAFP